MTKIIRDWNDLVGLEAEHYAVIIDKETGQGFIAPNLFFVDDDAIFFGHHYEISKTHNNTCEEFVELLKKYNFDVEFDDGIYVDIFVIKDCKKYPLKTINMKDISEILVNNLMNDIEEVMYETDTK